MLELGATDDPVWTYFDSQHKFILNQMNQAYKTAMATIRSMFQAAVPLCATNWTIVTRENKAPSISGPDDLSTILSQQLQSCFIALETKQSEAMIGE